MYVLFLGLGISFIVEHIIMFNVWLWWASVWYTTTHSVDNSYKIESHSVIFRNLMPWRCVMLGKKAEPNGMCNAIHIHIHIPGTFIFTWTGLLTSQTIVAVKNISRLLFILHVLEFRLHSRTKILLTCCFPSRFFSGAVSDFSCSFFVFESDL